MPRREGTMTKPEQQQGTPPRRAEDIISYILSFRKLLLARASLFLFTCTAVALSRARLALHATPAYERIITWPTTTRTLLDSTKRSETAKRIRSWGCGRSETPLIFVHIGKSGGGSINVRIAASALNYNSTKKRPFDLDTSFYPVGVNASAYFCAHKHPNFFPDGTVYSFPRTLQCQATTPLGQAIGCPEPAETAGTCRNCLFHSDHCHVVYVGHAFLGGEMHWLPQPILSRWLESKWRYSDTTGLQELLKTLLPGNTDWCAYRSAGKARDIHVARSEKIAEYKEMYEKCSVPRQFAADQKAAALLRNDLWQKRRERTTDDYDWSPIYASLPVLRITVIREPFSWLISKFFWHRSGRTCDESITFATFDDGTFWEESGIGWATRYAMEYIIYLCGNDCAARYEMGVSNLEQIEIQAANNLRNSFAVVGLLNETENFFDMVTARVSYMNMSLNSHIKGPRHSSGNSNETQRCKDTFQNPDFQAKMREASPAIAALCRLYLVAVEVNRFQLKELSTCDSSVGSL